MVLLAYEHLNDTDTYNKLAINPTTDTAKDFALYIKHLQEVGTMTSLHLDSSSPFQCIDPTHIFLPKLHKTPLKMCSIVAHSGGPMHTTSAYLHVQVPPFRNADLQIFCGQFHTVY